MSLQLKRINSKSLLAVGYDPTSSLLGIKFKLSGSVYAFIEVNKDIYNNLLNARSKGYYFNKYIKGNYKSYKIG